MKLRSILTGTVFMAALVSTLSAQPQVFGSEHLPAPTRADVELNYSVQAVTYQQARTSVELSIQLRGSAGRYPVSFYWIDDRRTRHPATFIQTKAPKPKQKNKYESQTKMSRLLLSAEDRIGQRQIESRGSRARPHNVTVNIPAAATSGQLVVVVDEQNLFSEPNSVNNIRNLKISGHDLALTDIPSFVSVGRNRILKLKVRNDGITRSRRSYCQIETTPDAGRAESARVAVPSLAPGEVHIIEKRIPWNQGTWEARLGIQDTNTANNRQGGRVR